MRRLLHLDTMIADMPGSPMIALYEMERALIQLDSTDDASEFYWFRTH